MNAAGLCSLWLCVLLSCFISFQLYTYRLWAERQACTICAWLTYTCNVCNPLGWLEPLLDRIARNSTTVVCPVIDVIDDTTMEYHWRDSGGVNVGGFDWNLQFNWHAVPERERIRHKVSAKEGEEGGNTHSMCDGISIWFVYLFRIFFPDDRVQPNQCIRQRWPVACFPLIANFLNVSAITIRTLIFGVVKILNCHSNRGCAVEHWKLCHARMLDISLESDRRTRYVNHDNNNQLSSLVLHLLLIAQCPRPFEHVIVAYVSLRWHWAHRDALRYIVYDAVILPEHLPYIGAKHMYLDIVYPQFRQNKTFMRFHFVPLQLESFSGVRVWMYSSETQCDWLKFGWMTMLNIITSGSATKRATLAMWPNEKNFGKYISTQVSKGLGSIQLQLHVPLTFNIEIIPTRDKIIIKREIAISSKQEKFGM